MTREERMDKAIAGMSNTNARRLSAIEELGAANAAYSKAVEDYNVANAVGPSITIVIDTGNAAFEESCCTESARILRALADRFETWGLHGPTLYDVNGNRCGAVTIGGTV